MKNKTKEDHSVKKVISEENLRKLCLSNKWFTDCTSSQFSKLLQANAKGCSLDELAAIIWVCSDTAQCCIGQIADTIRNIDLQEDDERRNQIQAFAERKVPAGWNTWDMQRRREFWAMSYTTEVEGVDLVQRDRISAIEIWCELFNGSAGSRSCISAKNIRVINRILSSIGTWRYYEKPLRFGPYGAQRGFIRSTK